MPSDGDQQRELRGLFGRAASANNAGSRAVESAASRVVFALANGGLSDPGPERLAAAAAATEEARHESALINQRVKDAQRAVDLLQPGEDTEALRVEALSLIQAGEALCETADEIRTSLPYGFGDDGAVYLDSRRSTPYQA